MAPTYSTDLLQAYIRHGTLGVVYMILEWLSFRNEICSRVKFVLHLSEKIKQLRLRRSHSCHSPQITLFAIFNFEGSFFQIAWNFISKQEFHSQRKPEWLVWEQNITFLLSWKQAQRNVWRWNKLIPGWAPLDPWKKGFYKCLIIIIIIIIIITIIIFIDIVNFQFQVQNGDENVHLLKIDTSKAFEKFSGKYLDSTDSGEEMFHEFHSSLTHSFHPV